MELIKLFFKSMVTGASMLIPGLSGGTTALLLGIYHPLLHAASAVLPSRHIRRRRRSSDHSHPMTSIRQLPAVPNLLYLAIAALGALLGIVLFASPASHLYAAYKLPATLVFVACAAFGLPTILKTGGVHKFADLRLRDFVLIGAGFLIVLLLFFLPSLVSSELGFFGRISFCYTAPYPLFTAIFFLLSGIVLASALILPGISFSHMLLLLGLYAPTLNAIAQHNLPYLLALASSLILGCLVTLRACESLMTRHPRASTLFIFGFVLASCCQIIIDCF